MGNCLHVLFFSDSPDDAAFIVQNLEQAGLTINHECIGNPEKFKIALLKQYWDLILAENKASHFDPYFALTVRNEFALDIPLIILADKYSDHIALGLLNAGASDYISRDQISRLLPSIIRELDRPKIRKDNYYTDNIEGIGAEALLIQTNERLVRAALVSKSGNWEYNLETGIISSSVGAQKLYGLEGEY